MTPTNLTPYDAMWGPEIPRSDMNAAPGNCQALVPSIHTSRAVRLMCYTARQPDGNSPYCYVYLITAVKVLAVYDLRELGMSSDCWGAFPFVSGDTSTIKITVNVRGQADGRNRRPLTFDTRLSAYPRT